MSRLRWLSKRSGELTVTRNEDLLVLDFSSRPAAVCPAPPELIEGLGAPPRFTAKARDYLAVFDSEETVRNSKPDLALVARLDALGIIATAPGEGGDFLWRLFAPRVAIP